MTLAQRLLIATVVLTITTTLTLGLGVRQAWRHAEEEDFNSEFLQTSERLRDQVQREVSGLPALIGPLCSHDVVLDSVLVDLENGRLDPGQRLALSLRVPSLRNAFRFDELYLVTGRGEILGAATADPAIPAVGVVGARSDELGQILSEQAPEQARLATRDGRFALQAHCSRRAGGHALGLIAVRHLEPLLREVETPSIRLGLTRPAKQEEVMVREIRIPELGPVVLHAYRSRAPLLRELRRLDTEVFLVGFASLAAALVLAFLLSRGLARPIVNLAREAKAVVHGEPKPVRGGGGRELEEFAATFNQVIADLTAMRKRLAATERIAARREIARRVAHEIKNPLAPIRAAVETLRRLRARSDPRFDGYFDEATRTVLDEVGRITNIVQEFTRFARLPPPNPAPMDLAETVQKVVGLHHSETTPVKLATRPCPPITADRDQMVQVLTNLIQNAIDAAAGREHPEVTVELEPREGDQVTLRVRDNGAGVAPEMRDRLFEPYATNKEKGTGLGLAIVHRIVVEHGGEISFREPAAGGAEFSVTLPVSGPPLLPEAPPPSAVASHRP